MKLSTSLFRSVVLDVLFIIIAVFAALFLRMEGDIHSAYFGSAVKNIPVMIVVQYGIFWLFGLYHISWQYASLFDGLRIFAAVTASSVVLFVAQYAFGIKLPVSIYFVAGLFNLTMTGCSRYWGRIIASLKYRYEMRNLDAPVRVLIVGAGEAGAMLVREIQNHHDKNTKICGLIDDDKAKIGKTLLDVRVLGNRDNIVECCVQFRITDIYIALPSVPGSVIREITEICRTTSAKIKILPSLFDIAGGKVMVSALRTISIEDLLQRDTVDVGNSEVLQFYAGKRILVTGAGGSIGSEICRQLAGEGTEVLLLLGKGENSIFLIEQELKQKFASLNYRAVICDVRDGVTMEKIFAKYRPQVVFHAAAHKHVPLMEHQPDEAVNNNVLGTCTVARLAAEYGAEQFVLVSTDKAVNPTNIMGTSKRVAELVVKAMNIKCNTTSFCAVRFGNVLGSRGSVVPIFRKQIEEGGPVTVTHPEMKRYFMTIPEACRLVIRAGTLTSGGEVFLLNMGEPVRIVDLALEMIKLSGLMPYQDIDIKYTGLRPGEKLFEELWKESDPDVEVVDNSLFVLKEQTDDNVVRLLDEVGFMSGRDEAVQFLRKWVPEYRQQKKLK